MKFIIPENPTPAELSQLLAICSNEIGKVVMLASRYKAEVATKKTAYEREYAKAIVKYKGSGNAEVVKALAKTDPAVIKAADELEATEAAYILANAEVTAWDTHHTTLRKMASLLITEAEKL